MDEEYSGENLYGLLDAVMSRLHRDLNGPRDSGKDGWDLCCKALLWFMFSEGVLSFPRRNKADEFFRYLFKKVVNTSRKFALNEDLICLGLFALKKQFEQKGESNEV